MMLDVDGGEWVGARGRCWEDGYVVISRAGGIARDYRLEPIGE